MPTPTQRASHRARRGAPSRPEAERGSAMIIALMIMIILTLVGVTFLVLSEQEERISVNARDHIQALYVAEAAVEIAKTWFNDPTPPPGNPLKPATTEMNRTLRKGAVFKLGYTNENERSDTPANHPEVDASQGATYEGGQGTSGGATPFEKPYRGPESFTLWGRRDTPDVLICNDEDLDINGDDTTDCGAGPAAYLDDLNAALLVSTSLRDDGHSPRDLGSIEVEQIRVYRPPLDFTLGLRYGIATIEAVAVKRVRGRKVTERVVREVLQEIPFPGPAGAIETEGEVVASGSSGVHWGQVVSSSRNNDNIVIRSPGSQNHPWAPVPRSSPQRWGYHYTMNPASYEDVETSTPSNTTVETLLTALLGITKDADGGFSNGGVPAIGDPWLIFKARQAIEYANGPVVPAGELPYPFNTTVDMTTGNNQNFRLDKNARANHSNRWQDQPVRFPPIEYDTWKQVAKSGQSGMHYYQHSGGSEYQENGAGEVKDWIEFIDINQGASPGVHFFDTTDSSIPLDTDDDGWPNNLTPEHDWGAGPSSEGFIYVNAVRIDSAGSGNTGVTVRAKMPGEPFLDDGIELHDGSGTTDNCICIRYDDDDGCVLGVRPIGFRSATEDCRSATNPDGQGPAGDSCRCPFNVLDAMDADVAKREANTFRDGVWDIDIDNDGVTDGGKNLSELSGWSTFSDDNGDGEGNGHGFEEKILPHYPITQRLRQGRDASVANGDWRRDPRFANDAVVFPTRQPHEPFLNFDYPAGTTAGSVTAWSETEATDGVKVDYQATGDYISEGGATTIGRDATGGAMDLENIALNGILFNEGDIEMTGNRKVYGSLAIRRGFDGTGSIEIWFNEDLVKGGFPPPEWNLPRVFSSARETN